MTESSLWASYGGTARVVLAFILLTAAGGLAYAGTRFRRPVRAARPGRTATICMLLAWVFSGVAFLVCDAITVDLGRHYHATKVVAPADPIHLVTATAVVILFVIVFIATPDGLWMRLTSAVIAAIAAPMIFELPFDLIIMARVNLPSPDPAWFLAMFFAPFVALELTTLSLLRLSPMVKLSRPAFFSLAAMLLVFAVWALAGFGYPNAPVPIAMNVTGKILAFVTALSLFFPEWFPPRRRKPDSLAEEPPYVRDERSFFSERTGVPLMAPPLARRARRAPDPADSASPAGR
jgi:hypothetical protein